ncbi:MAG: tripartite tricarboxylate transporter substrate binding protein, partial [Alphaproteobacteria bacterium]|nr:tripartite tricarboxylate transporter substrate binding protein [Alphaproteobacteria bacterium]
AAAIVAPQAGLQAAEADFFKGKTATYIVATGAGGGFDFYGRLVAQFMQKNLPGSTFIVRNMPGAGHIIGLNYIYNSKPDGLTLGTFNTAMFLNQILEKKGVRYDMSKMNYLGKLASSYQILMISDKQPYRSMADLKKSGEVLKMATGGPGSGRWMFSKIAEEAYGIKFQLIPGYDGPDATLAIMRGEIDIMTGSIESNAQTVQQGRGHFLAIFAPKREKDYPNLPTVREEVSDPDARALARIVEAIGGAWRITGLPPGLPAGRLAVMRAAYKKGVQDPAFDKAVKNANRDIDPAFGADVDKVIRDAMDVSPKIKNLLQEAVLSAPKVTYLKHTGPVTQTKRGGRRVFITYQGKEIVAKVSGSRTKVSIDGKPDKRKNVKAGMTCTFVYLKMGGEAKELNCKN